MVQDAWISLVDDAGSLAEYARWLELGSGEASWTALSRRIASSRTWRELPPARLVLRLGKWPVLALHGAFSEAHAPLLSNFRANLLHSLQHLRWMGWPEVCDSCADLANRIALQLGDELPGARFEAIPRGGYIVLGLVAKLLGLDPDQMLPVASEEPPVLVVVDDCSLSGVRFHEFLEKRRCRRVVFAHLASHRDLRSAILEREPRVEACLASVDLEEPGKGGDGPEDSREIEGQVRREDGKKRFWLGRLEHICFPWNEPDRLVWDPVGQRALAGWPVIPEERCLKAVSAPDLEIPLHILREPQGAVSLPPGVVYFQEGEGVAVADLEGGTSLRLSGTAASFWEALIRSRTLPEAEEYILQRYEVAPGDCRRDLSRALETFVNRGLLRPGGGSP